MKQDSLSHPGGVMTTDWTDDAQDDAQKKNLSLAKSLTSPPAQIWRSRISWRIALTVFLTILTVQIAILTLTVKQEEMILLNDIRESGRIAIAPLIESNVQNPLGNPVTMDEAERLLTSTLVEGVAVYTSNLELLSVFGDPVGLFPKSYEDLFQTNRTMDGNAYEVIYRRSDLDQPYVVAARLNAASVSESIISYVRETIVIVLLMSLFVTSVLMISLGRWLLEPILFLRQNLLNAAESPEDPQIEDSPFDEKDEIGGAIALAQVLINQNADNIKHVKSAAEDKIHKLAFYDSLTGLPNRTLFLQKLSEMTKKAGQEKTMRLAVVTMDLDHFKDINDSMGHNVGDAILRGVSKRLRAALPESAVVARSGEDEFAVTMPLSTDVNTARDVADKVRNVLISEPFKVFNEQFQIRTSVGVATYPDDSIDPGQVLKNADIALNRAKEDGRDRIKEYSEDFDKAVQARFQMLRDLRDALDNDELLLHYQPQFDLQSGRLIGAEALLRWFRKDNSKAGGQFVSPADFVPIAEQSGLIVPIGSWVIRQACETAAQWQKAGHEIRIAVNVSGAQFYQGNLVELTSGILEETGLKPENLEMEVTESIFMEDVNHTIETLKQLHGLGIELAIDDFGTGYSSLSYLRQFPIDRLKIDQSFIRNALNDNNDASIAKTIVNLGHSLNLKVIAEGVETKDHEDFLRSEGCDEVQGFRYSRPIPAEEFDSFIKSYSGDLSSFD